MIHKITQTKHEKFCVFVRVTSWIVLFGRLAGHLSGRLDDQTRRVRHVLRPRFILFDDTMFGLSGCLSSPSESHCHPVAHRMSRIQK
jgi:hypothetical protein